MLIKNTYGKGSWTLPGGGVEKNEAHYEAAKREVFEEVGIKLSGLRFLGIFSANIYYKRDTVYCYYAAVEDKSFKIDPVEILEARWFPKNNLPQPLSPNMQKFMELYKKSYLL